MPPWKKIKFSSASTLFIAVFLFFLFLPHLSEGALYCSTSCAPGRYVGGPDNCTVCPAGHYCDGSSKTACPAGKYNPNTQRPNLAGCINCPAGSYCPTSGMTAPKTCDAGSKCPSDGASSATQCTAGTFSAAGAISCRTCDKGHISAAGASNCSICPSNKVSSAARTSCDNCPAGKECTNPIQDPANCPMGSYSLTGAAVCTTCPAGKKCPTTTAAPTDCGSGTYSSAGATTCITCPAGYQCSTTAATICAAGTYSVGSAATCTPCSIGKYCLIGATAEITCDTGYYQTSTGQSSCIACPAGKQCTSPSIAPTNCPTGQYSLGKATACSACPAGHVCPNAAANPVPCSAGNYVNAVTDSTCTVCPAGKACPSASATPTVCVAGTYSGTGQTSCTPCPAGKKCPNVDNPSTVANCAPGTFSVQSQADCTTCTAGNYCPDRTSNLQKPCSSGTYSAAGATSCTTCPAGKACPNKDGTGIITCSAGKYSISGSTSCSSCPKGYYCPDTNQATVILCPDGFYSLGNTSSCTPCPAGKYCPNRQKNEEIECANGYYSVGNQTTCTKCPAGYYCPTKTTDSRIRCPSGTYSLGALEQCVVCPEGFYCPRTDTEPLACSAGYYSLAKKTECTACEAGYYCPRKEGSYKKQCPPGQYSFNASVICTTCSPGFVCKMGSVSATPPDGLCPQGHYCADGQTATPCPPGTYNDRNGSTSVVFCIQCPAGYYCQEPGLIDYRSTPCPQGYYCPVGTSASNRYPCPAGFYNNITGTNSASACKPCTAGNYCPKATEVPTLACPAGFYCLAQQSNGFQNTCPLGTWSNRTGLTSSSQCYNCTVGHYCPAGTEAAPRTAPLPCAAGTYNPTEGGNNPLNCLPCTAGKACPTAGLAAPSLDCQAGFFCPSGSISNNQFPCLPGTFSNSTSLKSADECSPCPERFFCPYGTGGANMPKPCTPGYYCPVQSPTGDKYKCPAGTYSNRADLAQASECTDCPPGSYCIGGKTTMDGTCPKAYYCPAKTVNAYTYGCANGTYNPKEGIGSQSECADCLTGHYCQFADSAPRKCRAGTYMDEGFNSTTNTTSGTAAKRQQDCKTCPGGSYCLEAQVTPIPCGTGKYSKDGQSTCVVCEIGHYCDSATTSYTDMKTNKRCPAGKYCVAGLASLSAATDCSTGRYCEEATVEELKCPVGTMRNTVGARNVTDCSPCTEGYYCLEGTVNPNGPCTTGHYCPSPISNPYGSVPPQIGSYGDKQEKCPAGTYANTTGTKKLSDCTTCDAGYTCKLATTTPTECPQGSYCPAGSVDPTPCPQGTYGSSSKLKAQTDCTPCDPGKYCDAPGITAPKGSCDPGYLCWSRAVSKTPNDNITGVICPPGGYCVTGSFNATPCPLGTYSNTSGAVNTQDCRDCPQGYYCSKIAGGEPTGQCYAGYFCNGSAKEPTQHIVGPGQYSYNGSTRALLCPLGSYQDLEGQGYCKDCPIGYFCNETTMTAPNLCQAGTYCPVNSTYEIKCPSGTFSNQSGLSAESNCTTCPPGMYCSNKGTTAPAGKCKAGHICTGGALYDNPEYNNDSSKQIVLWGDVCKPGYYCPAGSSRMYPCPLGTFNPDQAKSNETTDCRPCTPGYYCDALGLSAPTNTCSAGYYCVSGATSATPSNSSTGGPCPTNYYCPVGVSVPRSCVDGKMANKTGASICELCPAGFLCKTAQAPELCPTGSYCPASTVSNLLLNPKSCPIGKFNNLTGLSAESQCLNCTAGMYCQTVGLSTPTGPMDAGSWSLMNARLAAYTETNQLLGSYGICPRGFYCPQQTSSPFPCPRGSYGTTAGLKNVSECTLCPNKHYCPDLNRTECDTVNTAQCPLCDDGYYCLRGSPYARPVNSSYGDICPKGYRCTGGERFACGEGTYQNQTGQTTCLQCPAGYYCGAATGDPLPCNSGHYCAAGTTPSTMTPCSYGTYNNVTGGSDVSFCRSCPPGQYCPNKGLSQPVGPCNAGYYCVGSASNASFASADATGGPCTKGHYCPEGCTSQFKCPAGYYCPSDMMTNYTQKCSAGFYCSGGASVSNPTDGTTGNRCPMGHYCEEGSSYGKACPPGTYRNDTGGAALSDCYACPKGYYCAGQANIHPTNSCMAGFYCDVRETQPNPSNNTCPQGHYCPTRSIAPIRCESGTYQDKTIQGACIECPSGFFCDNTKAPVVLFNSSACPEGYYCPPGTKYATEYPCPKGTFSNITGIQNVTSCQGCPGGYYCDELALKQPTKLCTSGYFCRQYAATAAPNQGNDANICPAGFYCPPGTTEPVACPLGTYSSRVGLNASSECLVCTAGFYCGQLNSTAPTAQCQERYFCPNGSSVATQMECTAGGYCPLGSAAPLLCPAPLWSNATKLKSVAECLACPAGSYCGNDGLIAPSGDCKEGYYCPLNTTQQMPNATFCPVGHYCPTGSAQPLPCRNGTYMNHTHAPACYPCPASYYCPYAGEIKKCPQGYYCPAGTAGDIRPCPRGTYGARELLMDVNECTPCAAGKFCDGTALTAVSGSCDPGYWCKTGVDVKNPGPGNSTDANVTAHNFCRLGWGGPCTVGHYCPGGTSDPVPCENGTYADTEGHSSCNICPQGYYCPLGAVKYTDYPCPSGYYCPNGTKAANEFPCPRGTYNNRTGRAALEECLACPGGQYCDAPGLSTPSGLCAGGYYCKGSATTDTPIAQSFGDKCTAGYYCPLGSSAMQACTPGKFCASDYLNATSGDCTAGYYCTSAAVTATPTDNVTGNACPKGAYCPQGSPVYQLCPAGTYLNRTRGIQLSDCVNCTAGKYCIGAGNAEPSGPCAAGYYCPEGQASATPGGFTCPAGYYCEVGSAVPVICPNGTYQNEVGQSACKPCPPGYFCDNSVTATVNFNTSNCPMGYYCPQNTTRANEFPCPAGTFNNITNREKLSDCIPCSPGKYCSSPGLSSPNGDCSAGYYCRSGAASATPLQDINANECPVGYYCPAAATDYIACPPGKFGNVTRLTKESECHNCTGGSYCPAYNMTSAGPECFSGYYCPIAADKGNFIACPAGSFCPQGSVTPQPCPQGTYSNSTLLTRSADCTTCPAGYYCQQTGLTYPEGQCQQGYYCPAGSDVPNKVICPLGMHCPTGSAVPTACTAGTFTNTTGRFTCDVCPEGYYCTPVNFTNAGTAGVYDCPAGYYCPNGTGLDWKQCPLGTYSNQIRLSHITQCRDCDGGRYCNQNAATSTSGPCAAGYYCTSGLDKPNPDSRNKNASVAHICPIVGGYTGFGDVCPLGHYCPEGSSLPLGCDAGKYQDQIGQSTCKTCPEGYYCVVNSTEFSSQPCPVGHYCPAGTNVSSQFPCPAGSFQPHLRQTNSSSCLSCTPGSYCLGSGLSAPTNSCAAGWYCSGGARTATPAVASEGGQCQPGFYCPEGSIAPLNCTPAFYCATAGLANVTGPCQAGYYCVMSASRSDPSDGTTGNVCPMGHFCPQQSSAPTKCPQGFYLNSTGNTQLSNCLPCEPGKYCDSEGLATPTGSCQPKFYCPKQQVSATPANYSCPQAYYCVGDLGAPEPCPSGSYQDLPGQSTCKGCPERYFCNATSGPVTDYTGYVCPTGFYCPNNTASGTTYPCPLGTYNNQTNRASADECTPCVGGMACDRTGLTVPERDCSAGYFCKRGANSATPSQGVDANICPVGHYCVQKTTNPVPCPQGTFSNTTGLGSAEECTNCTAGYYCNSTGLLQVAGPCTASYYCPPRSVSATQVICPVGNYCPLASAEPTKCPNGTFANRTGVPSEAECNRCTPGQYCPTTGMTEPQGPCNAGYYCPLGSDLATEVTCPIGAYCPGGTGNYLLCPIGQLTEVPGQSSCSFCPEGFYCVQDKISAGVLASVKHPCPEGFYCPNGTGYNWQSCPVGTYSNVTGLKKVEECLPCTGGRFCQGANLTTTTGNCLSGYYCTSGAKTATPSGNETCVAGHNVVAAACPIGHYCPVGTDYPIPCPAGSYQDTMNQAVCKACPKGYYCLANTSAITNAILCPIGHYCPQNTTTAVSYPCPAGTFNNRTGGDALDKCLACTPGYYCAGTANENPDAPCTQGYYCAGGASNATDTICPIRTFCPTGSHTPSNCTAGQYCSRTGLATPEGPCDAGWYCPQGSASRQEIRCPVGHHCVNGSALPMPCNNGTFGPTTGLRSQSECSLCTAGSFCNATGLSAVSGSCAPAFYCPEGQVLPTPAAYACPYGHFCVGGKGAPDICPRGQYQNLMQQTSCKECAAGYYCDNSGGPIANLTGRECVAGHYCPNGTETATQFPCPIGTYLNTTSASSRAQCTSCDPKMACTRTGLASPNTPCMAGYYCAGGNNASNPSHAECPVGNYCPEGSSAPIPCPSGTIAPSTRNTNLTDCKACPPGNYCTPASSAMGRSLLCDAGYICVSGASVARPIDGTKGYICPKGHYCPSGAVKEIVCEPGTYGPTEGLGVCTNCPAGKTCQNRAMNSTEPCPVGHYCTVGTADNGTACPTGTYNPLTGQSLASACLPCDGGKFCGTTGLSAPTGNCTAGWLCVKGAKVASPSDGTNIPCPAGHYCLVGAVNATKCPTGTFRSNPGAASVDQCYPCTAGRYCETEGLVGPTGTCDARYYCPDVAKISSAKPAAYICPAGWYCPAGSGTPTACPPGRYQPNNGSIDCVDCPPGYYCLSNTSVPALCPAYHYCPGPTIDPIHCTNGTYTNASTRGLSKEEQCSDCVPGQYCVGGRIAGDCAPGYWCKQGAPVPNPTGNATVAELCPRGFYCPAGTPVPRQCPPGKFIGIVGAYNQSQCDICPAGFVCPPGATGASPCPPGYYCEYGAANQTACPLYTYNSLSQATNKTWCLPCPAGYFCDQTAMANISTSPCPAGYFCPEATRAPIACPAGTYRPSKGAGLITDCHPCDAGYYCRHSNETGLPTIAGIKCDDGYYCPTGSQNQTKCQAGFYCAMAKTQVACPPGYYCPEMSTAPQRCPPGHYCGAISCPNATDIPGAIEPVKCPEGYKERDGSPRSTFADTCQPCDPGYYGNHPNRTSCTMCRAGVVCLGASTTDQPRDNSSYAYGVNTTNSYPCPPGYYCPAGSGSPIACPAGRVVNMQYSTNVESCLKCPKHHFQSLPGQTACVACGAQARQPIEGSSTCECSGAGRDFQLSDRQCPCRAGFKQSNRTSSDCEKDIYELCSDNQIRDQYGNCLDASGWEAECRQVCGVTAYKGYDKRVPSCLCETDDLDVLCDNVCQKANQHMITVHCPTRPIKPFLRVSSKDKVMIAEIPLENLRSLINAENAISEKFCIDFSSNTSNTVNLVECGANGFLGVYSPDTSQLVLLLTANAKGTYTTNQTGSSVGGLVRRRLLASSTVSGSSFSGILNPVTCLEYGQVMMFTVSKDAYPIYDKDNLMNTNDKFDYGGFRALVEKMNLMSSTTTVFTYKFSDPGNYVFKLSSNPYKRMYIRVMAAATTCPTTGPFLPPTPINFVQAGMKLNSDIIKKPNWLLIGIFICCLVVAVILFILVIVLFRKYGWGKGFWTKPFYRYITAKYDFDTYASRGSVVNPYVKQNPNADAEEAPREGTVRVGRQVGGTEYGPPLPNSEFWDYERQLDLESFSARTVYATLERQSVAITRQIGKQKDRMKDLYQKLNTQTDSLKSLWLAKLQRGVEPTAEQQNSYERRLNDLEAEMQRRRNLGEAFGRVLGRQADLLEREEAARRRHEVEVQSRVREVRRLLQQPLPPSGDLTARNLVQKVRHLLDGVRTAVDDEGSRVGHTVPFGARLAAPDGSAPLSPEEVTGQNLSDRAKQLLTFNKTLGVFLPRSDAQILAADGSNLQPVPPDSFVHPRTGLVLPLAGNLVFDPHAAQFSLAANATGPDLPGAQEPPLPFVPQPRRAPLKLRPLTKDRALRLGCPMACPKTGLTVPILGVSVDLQSGNVLPVGGTHTDPVTGLPTPIELGGLMFDPHTKTPVPIVGTCIDPETGDVLPVGEKSYLWFDAVTEPLSGRVAQLHTAGADSDERLWPSPGGMAGYTTARVLVCEAKLRGVLEELNQQVAQGKPPGPSMVTALLEGTVKELEEARSAMKRDLLRLIINVERRRLQANELASSGGTVGWYDYAGTGKLLPVLIGTLMEDPGGSEFEVPILGCRRTEAGVQPLGGTMEDPEGAGLVPITMGRPAVDPATGEVGAVVGATVDSETNQVLPVTVKGAPWRKRQPDPVAAGRIEEEQLARRSYWRRVRTLAEDITLAQFQLSTRLVYSEQEVPRKEVKAGMDKVVALLTDFNFLRESEIQRRVQFKESFSEHQVEECVPLKELLDNDDLENESGKTLSSVHNKFKDNVDRLNDKIRAEDQNFTDAKNYSIETEEDVHNVEMRHQRKRARLRMELIQGVISLMENLEKQHAELSYFQRRSELLLEDALGFFNGTLILAGDYCASFSSSSEKENGDNNDELVALIRHLIALLEGGGPFYLTSELLNLIGGGGGGNNLTVVGGGGGGSGGGSGRVTVEHQGAKIETATHVGAGAKFDTTVIAASGVGDSSSQMTDERQSLYKEIFARQALELAKEEAKLRDVEIKDINAIINASQEQKDAGTTGIADSVRAKLLSAKTEEEVTAVMADAARQLETCTEALEAQKQRQLEETRKRLLEQRRRLKKELKRNHMEEMEQHGFAADDSPSPQLKTNEEIGNDLLRLQLAQEQLLTDLRKAQVDSEGFNTGVDERLKRLHSNNLSEEETGSVREQSAGALARRRKAEEVLGRRRRNATRDRRAKEIADATIPDEEKSNLLVSHQQIDDNTHNIENAALLKAVDTVLIDAMDNTARNALEGHLKASHITDEEREAILRKHDAAAEQIRRQLAADKEKQREALVAKLAARRRMAESRSRESAVDAELQHVAAAEAAKHGPDGQATFEAMQQRVGSEVEGRVQAVRDRNAAELEQMEAEHLTRLRKELGDIDAEEAAKVAELNQQIDEQRRLSLEANQKAMERALDAKGLSQSQYDQLMEKFRGQSQTLSASFEDQRQQQQRQLREKMAARRQLKANHLQESHDEAVAAKMAAQQKARTEAARASSKEVEHDVLGEHTKGLDPAKTEEVVFHTLLQRHLKELVDLEGELESSKAARVGRDVNEVRREREEERRKFIEAHEAQRDDLARNLEDLSPQELEKRKKELEAAQKKQLQEFDEMTEFIKAKVKKDTEGECDLQGTYRHLDLKERHLQELADAMRLHSPADELRQKYAVQLTKYRDDAEKYKKDTLKRLEEDLHKAKDIYSRIEAEKQQELKKRLNALESEVEKELEKERESEQRRQRARQGAMLEKIEEGARRDADLVKRQTELGEEERNRQLKEIMELQAKQTEALKKEQQAMQKKLEDRLEAKRRQQRALATAKVFAEEQNETEKRLMEELMNKYSVDGARAKEDAPDPYDHWLMRLLEQSPLFATIVDIDEILEKAKSLKDNTGAADGAEDCGVFVDERDAQFILEGNLAAMKLGALNPAQVAVYQFGILLIRLLHRVLDTPNVKLLLAEALPKNNYTRNAFKNSVFYEHSSDTLFVRVQRAENVGDFMVVIVHSIAHLHTGEMINDSEPQFLKYFYKCLRVIARHVLFSRDLSSPLDGSSKLKKEVRADLLTQLVDSRLDVDLKRTPDNSAAARAAAYEEELSRQAVHNFLSFSAKPSYKGLQGRLSAIMTRQGAEGGNKQPTAGATPSAADSTSKRIDQLYDEMATLGRDLTVALREELDLLERLKTTKGAEQDRLRAAADKLIVRKQQLIAEQKRTESEIARLEVQLRTALS